MCVCVCFEREYVCICLNYLIPFFKFAMFLAYPHTFSLNRPRIQTPGLSRKD